MIKDIIKKFNIKLSEFKEFKEFKKINWESQPCDDKKCKGRAFDPAYHFHTKSKTKDIVIHGHGFGNNKEFLDWRKNMFDNHIVFFTTMDENNSVKFD